MIVILGIVIALVAWSLHLMQEAIDHKEFSLMLAGFLVASAAVALLGVYFLAGTCVTYLTHLEHPDLQMLSESDYLTWVVPVNE
jgi:hypothetical protein